MNATQQQRVLQAAVQAAKAVMEGPGGQMTVPALYTDYLPHELMDKPRDFFVYGVDFLDVAAGAQETQTFTVQNDSDFLIVAAAATAVDPADEGTAFVNREALTVAFADGGAGRNLQNQAQGFPNLIGTGELPCYWPFPKFIDRASDFATTLANNDPTDPVRVRLSFLGFKIFAYSG